MTAIDVRLRARWIVGVGYRYDVLLGNEVIVSRSRDPEYDTARVLHARGLRGRFTTIDFNTGKPRMILDIEKAAKLCTIERDRNGLRVEAHRPLCTDARTVLHVPPVHQGRVILGEVVPGTGQSDKRAGGETAGASRRVPEEA